LDATGDGGTHIAEIPWSVIGLHSCAYLHNRGGNGGRHTVTDFSKVTLGNNGIYDR